MSSSNQFYAKSILSEYTRRNVKSNPDIIKSLWDELQNESLETLNTLFLKMKAKPFYSDFDKTVPRMPIVAEWLEQLEKIKRIDSQYSTHEALPMSKNEKEKRKARHALNHAKIKELMRLGLPWDDIDRYWDMTQFVDQGAV